MYWMQEHSTPQNRLYFTFRKAGEGGRRGKGFPHFATNTEQNKTALQYVQSTFPDTAKVKLQILHGHLQHVQTSNSPREGAALHTSPSWAPPPPHQSREQFKSMRKTCMSRVTNILSPWQQNQRAM